MTGEYEMNIQEFFRGLKGDNKELLAEIEVLRVKYGLEKLYLVYMNDAQVVWGFRKVDFDSSGLAAELNACVKTHTGTDYLEKYGPDGVVMLPGDQEEVAYVLEKELMPYIRSHNGNLSIIWVCEDTGEVTVSLSGACESCPSSVMTMRLGVEQTLKHLLPWVKEVTASEKGVEPDFGIHEALSGQPEEPANPPAKPSSSVEEEINSFLLNDLRPKFRKTAGEDPDLSEVVVWLKECRKEQGLVMLGMAISKGTGCSPFCGCAAGQISDAIGEMMKKRFAWIKKVHGEASFPPEDVLKRWNH